MTDSETGRAKLSLQLKANKSKSSNKKSSAFGDDDDDEGENSSRPQERPRDKPLVIPVETDRWKGPRQNEMTEEAREAARALQASANVKEEEDKASSRVIAATKNSNTEREQYQQDLQKLPEELNIHSEQYQKVPIAEFGSALLRGMGWSGEETKGDAEMSLPRPHRLGLGATPDLSEPMHQSKKPLRPDQFKQQAKLQKQRDEYERQRIEKKKWDKQKTLQDGSLIAVGNKRAQVVQLVGVPGLNNVKIQYEGDTESTIVKRRDLGELLSRSELEERPFRQVEPLEAKEENKSNNVVDKRDESHRSESKRKDRKDDDEEKKRKRQRSEESRSAPRWVVPHIRVRIITEKLGRRYFKEKAVVVDVTPKGATLQLNSGSILDNVPERYLETALPKTGGLVMILKDHHPKGRLLEKGRNTGVVQFLEDMNVETISLDDMAEWVGSVDEEY